MLSNAGAVSVIMPGRQRLLKALPTQKVLVTLLMLIVAVVGLPVLVEVLADAFGMGDPVN